MELRKERNISQKKLADALNIGQSTVAQIELGRNEATASTIRKLSAFFNVSADYLLGLEDDFGIRTAAPSSATAGEPLTAEERQIIEEYRKLPESSKDLFKRMAGIKTTTKK